MSAKVIQMSTAPRRKPRNFTSAEAFYDEVRERIHMCGLNYRQIAEKAGLSPSTVGNIATSHTTWPRHTTLFPLLKVLGMRIALHDDGV